LKKSNKFLITYFVVFFTVWILFLAYTNYTIGNYILPDKIEKNFEFSKISKINQEKIFVAMENPENYPKVFQTNVLSVKIINQTNNEIIAEEEISEAGIRTKILVKHVIFPYEKHSIEILDVDAQGTTITVNFESLDSTTIINTKIKMKLKGILLPFGFLPQNNIQSAWNSVISGFEDYVEKNE